MNKTLKWILISLGTLLALLFFGFLYMQTQTKKASPEATVTYNYDKANISVFYNRPYKRGRVVFGDLVPYGEVWRTGANEATTFSTSSDLWVNGDTLPAGKYTLWTIPGESEWKVIWNGSQYSWGVTFGAKASRDPEKDVLVATVPVTHVDETLESFTISFSKEAMTLAWDQTEVIVPMHAN